MKSKLISKTITTTLEYKDKTIISSKVTRQPQMFYFSGNDDATNWDKLSGYIDLAPRGNFITKFVKRIWNLKKLEEIFRS
jgi:hypothetical protein